MLKKLVFAEIRFDEIAKGKKVPFFVIPTKAGIQNILNPAKAGLDSVFPNRSPGQAALRLHGILSATGGDENGIMKQSLSRNDD